MWMKRLRTLVTAMSGGLRTEQAGELQQTPWCALATQPDHARTWPVSGIIQVEIKTGLDNAGSQRLQLLGGLRRDLTQKCQRQMQIRCDHWLARLGRKVVCPPVHQLLLHLVRQADGKK